MYNIFNKNKLDLIFILFIAIFSSILVYLLINVNNNLGIYCSDVFVYLTNSLQFAGYPIGKPSALYLSPVICFLTSLIFRMGFIDQIVIFAVTGAFFPIAIIGVYLLLRLKFREIMSLFGAVLFASFSLNILWVANGSLDISAIAFSIFAIYFTILAVDKNPKYYLLAFPIFVLGFFTRYTVGFTLPLMILYILFKIDILNNIQRRLKIIFNKKLFLKYFKKLNNSYKFKYFIIGVIIALILFSSILVVISYMGSDLTFITQTQSAISGDKGFYTDPGFEPDPYFYLTNIPNFLSSENIEFYKLIPVLNNPSILSYFIIALITIGGLVYTLNKIIINYRKNKEDEKNKANENSKENIENRCSKKNKDMDIINIKIILIIIISIIIIFTYKEISSIISEILFLINILLIFNTINSYNNKKNKENDNNNQNTKTKTLNFNLLMISWFFIYLIFFSYSDVKVNRYFITVLPVIAYFTTYSLDYLIKTIINRKNRKIKDIKNNENKNNENKKNNESDESNKNNRIIKDIIPLVLIILFTASAFVNVGTIPSENKLINEPIIVSNWLMNYDPNYDTKVIWVYNVRYYTWYLKMNITGAYEKDIPKLEKNNVSYFISKNISKENYIIENYTIIHKVNDINIYERN